jgi:hypothetical protein
MDRLPRIALDFETYYDKRTYSLRLMTTEEYIRDSRFQVIGFSLVSESGARKWVTGPDDHIRAELAKVPWDKVAVVAHNAPFDGAILTWRYGFKPAQWIDTLGASRALYSCAPSHSLDAMAMHHLMPEKHAGALDEWDGVRREQGTPQMLHRMGEYCMHDATLAMALALLYEDRLPWMEWRLIDITTRMFTEPMFDGDAPLFDALAQKEITRTDELLRSLKTDAKALGSNDAFAALLEQMGVEPPRKTSPTTGKEVYAFAKTDPGMQELLEGADADVALLAEARLRVKSTNVVTRSQRMADIARRGKIPIPLNYWGAMVTGRHSGGGKMNALNLHVKSGIRSGFRAPPGYVVISGDSAQIELRSTLYLSREDAPLEILRAGGDLYKDTAAKLFSVPIEQVQPPQRKVGKIADLSLQYGAGDKTFKGMLRKEGVHKDIPGVDLDLLARNTVFGYRASKLMVVKQWERAAAALSSMRHGRSGYLDQRGIVRFEGNTFAIPGYPPVEYADLRFDRSDDGRIEFAYTRGRFRRRLYGPKVVENMVQYFARMIVMLQTVMYAERFPVHLSVYDEIVSVVPEDVAEEAARYMQECLSTTPLFCTDLPVKGEVHIGPTFGDVK